MFGLFRPDPHLLPLPRPERPSQVTILFYRYPPPVFDGLVDQLTYGIGHRCVPVVVVGVHLAKSRGILTPLAAAVFLGLALGLVGQEGLLGIGPL